MAFWPSNLSLHVPFRFPFSTAARRHREVIGLLTAVLDRQDNQEIIMTNVNDAVKQLGQEVALEQTEIGQLVALNAQLLAQAKASAEAAKNAPTAETLQALDDILTKAHANSQAMQSAISAGSASGQAAV